jgi:hypothetical protein
MVTLAYRRAARIGLVVVSLLVLGACGSSTIHRSSTSGFVAGRVMAGPTCPVERVGHPCPPRPVVAEVQARAAGRVVASTRSGADGSYRLELPVGNYTVGVVGKNLFPRCTARAATVTSTHTTAGDITCDTGLR